MTHEIEQPQWLTIQQVADRWSVSYDVVLKDVKASRIPSLRVGTLHKISREVVEAMEAKAKRVEHEKIVRSVRRARAFVASGKDHFPDVE